MLDFEAIRTTLWTWVSRIDPQATVIWLNPNAPAPVRPYTTLNINPVSSVGDDFVSRPDNNGIATITGNREFTLQIQTLGINADNRMEDIRMSLSKVTVQKELQAGEIAFVEVLSAQNITELETPRWEPRFSLDIKFRVASIDADDVGVIETVTGNAKYRDVDGETLFVQPITITVEGD